MRLLDAARAYARQGWHVFPLAPNAKVPAFKGGVNDATTDDVQLVQWFSSNAYNIGIALKASGMVCLDLDIKPEKLVRGKLWPARDGVKRLAELQAIHGLVGKPIIQRTASGAFHLLFRDTDGMCDVAGAEPGRDLYGIDVLSAGHRYIVAAPSAIDGKAYEWRTPYTTALAQLPARWQTYLAGIGRGAQSQAGTAPSTPRVGDALDVATLRVPGVGVSELESVLAAIPPDIGRDDWLRVIFGAAAQWADTPDALTALTLLDVWSASTTKDGQYKPGEVEAKWAEHDAAGNGRKFSWRGVRRLAREHGWTPLSMGKVNASNWKDHLDYASDKQGRQILKPSAFNSALYMAFDKSFSACLRLNRANECVEMHNHLLAPMRDITTFPTVYQHESDWPAIDSIMGKILAGNPGKQNITSAVETAARLHSYDPLHDYMEGLVWDGVSRLDEWLPRVTRAESTPLYRAYGRAWVIGMALRAMCDSDGAGVKMDSVLILQGPEGLGKTSVGQIFGDHMFYAEYVDELKSDELAYSMEGKMVLEFAELDTMTASEISRVKAIVTMQSDTMRRKYGRYSTRKARRCVFLGTTNDHEFIPRDATLRRWWIVNCPGKAFDMSYLRLNRNQIIAEAKHYADEGELPLLPHAVHEAHAAAVRAVTLGSGYAEAIADFTAANPGLVDISMADLTRRIIAREYHAMTGWEPRKFASELRRAGWTERRNGKTGRTMWSGPAVLTP